MEWNIDVVAIRSQAQRDGRGHHERAKVVGLLHSVASGPRQTQLVGQDGCGHCGAVVASPAHQHDTEFGHIALSADVEPGGFGRHLEPIERPELRQASSFNGSSRHYLVSTIDRLDSGCTIIVIGLDISITVRHIGAVHDDIDHFCSRAR